MKVVVRVRPENQKEANAKIIVQVLDEQCLLFDPKEQDEEFYYQGERQNFRDLRKKANKELRFNFNYVFDANTTNDTIYKCTTAEIIDDLINGFNCSIFAYGPTGAGKTFTMLGNDETPGITFMTMMGLYDTIHSMENKTFEVAVTYIEVYNEMLRDLLSNSKNLQIREDQRRGVLVAGISVHKPKTAEELLNMLRSGNLNRSQHSTDANAESSRSHAVFTVYVTQKDCGGKVTRGKMSFIDLAGSERATAISKNKTPRLREGANINKSLLALGNCINALADNKANNHVPYRDSKLTRLLKDSLGGNCKTIMIAAISPSQMSYEDTYNTLKYADRAQCIKIDAKQNVRLANQSVAHYIKLVNELNLEIERLKSELLAAKKTQVVVPLQPAPNINQKPVVMVVEAEKTSNAQFRANFEQVCCQELNLINHHFQLTRQLRDFEFRIYRKERRAAYIRYVTVGTLPVPDSTVLNLHHRFNALQTKKESVDQQIADIKQRKSALVKDCNITDEDRSWMNAKNQEIQIESLKQQNLNLMRTTKEMDMSNCINNRLLDVMLPIFRRQYTLLQGHGKGTSDVVEDYQKVANLVRDYKDVCWADEVGEENEMSTVTFDTWENSNIKLTSLEGLEWTQSKSDVEKPPGLKSIMCSRSLNFASENDGKSTMLEPVGDEDGELNSTFTKDQEKNHFTSRTALNVKSPPSVKYPLFKLSTVKSPLGKRTALTNNTSNNKLNKIQAGEAADAKKRRLSPVKNSPYDSASLRKKIMQNRVMARAHPYKLPSAKRYLTQNKESQENNAQSIFPKQTITSTLRTTKPVANDRPRLFS